MRIGHSQRRHSQLALQKRDGLLEYALSSDLTFSSRRARRKALRLATKLDKKRGGRP